MASLRRGDSSGSIRRSGSLRRRSFGSGEKKDGGGGLLGVAGDVLGDLKDAAVYAPAGFYEAGKGLASDLAELAQDDPRRLANPAELAAALLTDSDSETRELIEATAKGTYEDLRHPLRHPGFTLLTLLGLVSAGAGTAARGSAALSAAGRASGAAGKARAAGKALATRPEPGERLLRVGELEARDQFSRAPLTRAVQRRRDARQQAAYDADPSGRSARRFEKRVGGLLEQERRVTGSLERADALKLAALGKSLKPEEQMALRLVAEEAPVSKRIATSQRRGAQAASRREARGHGERVELMERAAALLDDVDGKPRFKPEQTKLAAVYEQLAKVSRNREELLAAIGRLSPEAAQAAKTRAGRVALGATFEAPTPGKLGVPSKALTRARQRVEALEKRFQRTEKYATFERNKRRLTEADVDARIRELEKWYDKAVRAIVPETSPFASAAEAAAQTRRARAANRSLRRGRAVEGGTPTFVREGSSIQHEAAVKAIDDLIRKNPDNPTLRRVRERIEELDSLRAAKTKLDDAAVFGGDVPKLGTTAERGSRFSERSQRLGGALSVARDELATLERSREARIKPTGVIGVEDFAASPQAVHIGAPVQRSKLTGRPKLGGAGTVGHPRDPGSLRQATGRSVSGAKERLDTTRIVAERGLEAARLTGVLRLREQLRAAGSPVPRNPDDLFMRLDALPSHKRLPEDVRRFIDDPDALAELTPEQSRGIVNRLRDAIFDESWRVDPEARAGFERLAREGKGVFVPRRLLGNAAKRDPRLVDLLPEWAVSAVDAINNAHRFAVLYLKPAYAVPNLLGNAALNLIQQGFAAPKNLLWAVRINHKLGPDVGALIDDLMGEGFARSLAGEHGVGARATQAAAGVWSKGVDLPFRRASFIHEARKAGHKTPKQIRELLENEAKRGELVDVTGRANRAIIDYGDLSPFEREVVRRVVYFYPWLKGATRYAGHLVSEHPVKAAAIGQVAKEGKERADESLGPVPSFLEGSFKVGGRIVNPASAAILQTPAEVGRAAAGLATGKVPGSELVDFASPVASALLQAATGRDPRYGFPVDGGLPQAVIDQFANVPQATLARTVTRGSRPGALYQDDARDALLRYLVGGIYPRRYNPRRLRELHERERGGR